MSPRTDIYAKNGVVAASQPLAVSAGIRTLQQGGSAVDAAIATSAVLAVVEPGASHLGGDAFVIFHDRNQKQFALNGSGEAPHQATSDQFPNGIPMHGFKSATLPGLVSTWFAAHEMAGRMPMPQLLSDAINYAQNGFPVNPGFVRRMAHHKKQFPDTKLFETLEVDLGISIGSLLKQPLLAKSLSAIAKDGRNAFYDGEIGEKLIESSSGWFSREDLLNHKTRISNPLTIKYRDYLVHGQPPPSQGMILMEELLIAEGFELANVSLAERIHIMVEAKKIAFADRYELLGDPDFVDVGIENLFSTGEVAKRRAKIDLSKANNSPVRYNQEGSDTTYFLVADSDGAAVSWIQSVFHGFGASWAIPGTGIILNNRLTGFSLDENSPNFIVPGRRPAHTLNAWLATRKDGSLAHVGGTPGANIQVQTNFQSVVNAIDLEMSPQENIDAPRWQHLNRPSGSDEIENYDGVLQIENRIPYSVISELKNLGHDVRELPPFGHGSAVQLLKMTEDGTFIAGSDPRVEGLAAGI